MSEPLDEDAPMAATVMADAVRLLQEATAGSVGYPGMGGVRDAEDIVAELARLAEQLQEAVAHLEGYLDERARQDQLVSTTAAAARRARRSAPPAGLSGEVGAAATQMTRLLNVAELTILEVKPAA